MDTEKGEKEEITRDLKLQVSELEVRINQLNESKEKEISKIKQKTEILQKKLTDTSDALAVKEEECKRIKVSFKEIKLKGTSNLDSLFDVCRVKAELSKAEENSKVLLVMDAKSFSNIKIYLWEDFNCTFSLCSDNFRTNQLILQICNVFFLVKDFWSI